MTPTATVKILTAFNVVIFCLLVSSLLLGAKADPSTVRARALELKRRTFGLALDLC